ncbi:hypothetical protein P343_01540 [Sporolactobacillus laevolacticus DSM 442]|uniref:DUF3784 domain-containing protein n=1 Tax=Sporolactobacillus laevolacticus DSM 442 TaxID=1395513 RepID=V6J1J0_9BACL|nr:hypothetical protein P343_01540 [Sporolactobacillus laevolacticus DSM 442]
MVIKIIIMLLGIVITIVGLLYSKSYHEKHFSSDINSGTFSDGIIGFIIEFVVLGLLSILPWYINKALVISIGLLLFVTSVVFI